MTLSHLLIGRSVLSTLIGPREIRLPEAIRADASGWRHRAMALRTRTGR